MAVEYDGAEPPAGLPRRPATVWPCPPPTPDPLHSGWLPAAVERIVTLCTRPGEPVLLVPAPAATGPLDDTDTDAGERLAHTAAAVTHLGRTVRVQTAADLTGTRSQSGPTRPGPEPTTDHAALVVTVVAPIRPGWFARIDWADLLTARGVLAVITQTLSRAGWLIDPCAELTAAAVGAGLALHDRIVLLEVPPSRLDQPPTAVRPGVAVERVHSDLLLFTPAGRPAAATRRAR